METKELIELFERNGLRRVDARALALFMDGKQRTSMEIEQEAGLRQPEVSATMPRMVRMGWFSIEYVKKEGKGRPYFIYSLAKAYSEICDDIARERGKMIACMMRDMNELRAVA
jgi:predicted transcriptional regulator